jgi:hypothetical protein
MESDKLVPLAELLWLCPSKQIADEVLARIEALETESNK